MTRTKRTKVEYYLEQVGMGTFRSQRTEGHRYCKTCRVVIYFWYDLQDVDSHSRLERCPMCDKYEVAEALTFDEIKARRVWLSKGSKSIGRTRDGVALFSIEQTHARIARFGFWDYEGDGMYYDEREEHV